MNTGTLLWTNCHTLYIFPRVSFTHQRSHVTSSHHVSLGSSWLWQFLSSCFWWPWWFWGILDRYLIECLSTGICLIFFNDHTKLIYFQKEDHRGKVSFLRHHIKGISYQHNLSLYVDLSQLAEVDFVRFLHCAVTLFLFFHTFFFFFWK